MTTLRMARTPQEICGSEQPPVRERATDRPVGSERREGEIIGWSRDACPLTVKYAGERRAPLRVLVIAGQHGDEPYGREAAEQVVRGFGNSFPSVHLAALCDVNPDGAYRHSRANAAGLDLNRDHLRLKGVETQAIHLFIRSWRPHLIIDAHNYPPRRRHLIERGLVSHYDVFVDLPTHPAVRTAISEEQRDDLFAALNADLMAGGFESERYTIISRTGRARHSTSDVVDARNCLSLRYGALTVLVEGRAPARADGRDGRGRAVAAQRAAIESILRWASRHEQSLTRCDWPAGHEGESVAIRCRRRMAGEPCRLKFRDAINRTVNVVTFPEFRPHVEITRRVELPAAYAIPLAKDYAIETLRRHGFHSYIAGAHATQLIESYLVEAVKPSKREHRAPTNVTVAVQKEERLLRNYALFPVNQIGGHALAVFLEPESKYGLHRYGDLSLTLRAGAFYPILRVLSRERR